MFSSDITVTKISRMHTFLEKVFTRNFFYLLELSRQLTTIWSNFVKTGTPRNPRVNKPYHASVHPVYRSPRTSLQGEGEEEEEKIKPKSILNTDFNWTNLAKKVKIYIFIIIITFCKKIDLKNIF